MHESGCAQRCAKARELFRWRAAQGETTDSDKVLLVTTDLHQASFDELDARTAYLLWKLRVDIFVVEQHCAYPELDGRDLEALTTHLWIADEAQPVAYLRVLAERTGEARIGRVCVAASARGHGLAQQLMQAALVSIGEWPSVLDAQTQLVAWYERFGYTVTGLEFLDDGIPHMPMRRPGRPSD